MATRFRSAGGGRWYRLCPASTRSSFGWPVVVPPTNPVAPRTPDDVLGSFLDALPGDRELILVPHSGAGLYVPVLTTLRRIVGCVFVDAGLPGPDAGLPGPDARSAPAGFLDFLRAKADPDGVLPLWTQWWDEADVAALFPSAESRAAVEREQRRLPLAYFEQSPPVPAGWDRVPG